jgi:hypothetical protein
MRRSRFIFQISRLTRHGSVFAAPTIFPTMPFGAFGFYFIEGLSPLDPVIVAIRRKTGEMIFQPSGDANILEGDLLNVIGRAETMQKLIGLAR